MLRLYSNNYKDAGYYITAEEQSTYTGGTDTVYRVNYGYTSQNPSLQIVSIRHDIQKRIAGYDVSQIVLSFSNLSGEAQLISVYIKPQTSDEKAAEEDLTGKLTQVYGEQIGRTWLGQENTAIRMYGSNLVYGTLDANTLLYGEQTEEAVDSNDTSGL